MRTSARRSRWFAWAGLAVSPAAWALHHQAGSDLNFWDCGRGGGPAIAMGVVVLGMAVAAGALSFVARKGGRDDPRGGTDSSTRFIAALGMMSSGLFSLTILVQIGAALILPPCFR
jgi:hypothetical protein